VLYAVTFGASADGASDRKLTDERDDYLDAESVPELASLLEELRHVTRRMRSDDDKVTETNDWKWAARVIDRLCFCVFSACLGLLTVVFLGLAGSRLAQTDHIIG